MAGAPESVDAGSWTAGTRSGAEHADAERGTGDHARSRDAETGGKIEELDRGRGERDGSLQK